MIISLPGRIGMNDRGARRSLSLVRHCVPSLEAEAHRFRNETQRRCGIRCQSTHRHCSKTTRAHDAHSLLIDVVVRVAGK